MSDRAKRASEVQISIVMECENTVSLGGFFITSALMFYCGFMVSYLISKRKIRALTERNERVTGRARKENPEMNEVVGEVMNSVMGMLSSQRTGNPRGGRGDQLDIESLVRSVGKATKKRS